MTPEDIGLKHLSHSSLDLWLRNRGGWYLRYVHGVRGGSSPAMIAGKAGEDAVGAFLANEVTLDQVPDYVVKRYDFHEKEESVARDDRKRDQIAACAPLVCAHLEGSTVLGSQEAVSLDLPGVSIPLIGYIDFRIMRPGQNAETIIDTKFTGRKPSDISYSHRRQGSGYGTAFPDANVSFVYGVLKSKPEVVEIPISAEAVEDGFYELNMAAQSLIKTLELASSKRDLVTMLTPVMDDFVWDGPMIDARKEVFGV